MYSWHTLHSTTSSLCLRELNLKLIQVSNTEMHVFTIACLGSAIILMTFSLLILSRVRTGMMQKLEGSLELPYIYRSYGRHPRLWSYLHHVCFILSGQFLAVWLAAVTGFELLLVFIGAPFFARGILNRPLDDIARRHNQVVVANSTEFDEPKAESAR